MAGRHRAPRPPRSLKIPAAAAGTVAALGVAAAVAVAAPSADPAGEAQAAAAQSTPSEQSASTTKSSSSSTSKRVTADKRTKQSRTSTPTTTTAKPTATATMQAPNKTKKPKPTKTAPPSSPCSTNLAGTVAPVAQVGNHVKQKFGVSDIGGRAPRSNASDHPSGLALDFMVDSAKGDKLAAYILANKNDFGVTYVIWKQRYNDGSGWSTMEDRGSPTANHYDHVHVSFSGKPVKVSC